MLSEAWGISRVHLLIVSLPFHRPTPLHVPIVRRGWIVARRSIELTHARRRRRRSIPARAWMRRACQLQFALQFTLLLQLSSDQCIQIFLVVHATTMSPQIFIRMRWSKAIAMLRRWEARVGGRMWTALRAAIILIHICHSSRRRRLNLLLHLTRSLLLRRQRSLKSIILIVIRHAGRRTSLLCRKLTIVIGVVILANRSPTARRRRMRLLVN